MRSPVLSVALRCPREAPRPAAGRAVAVCAVDSAGIFRLRDGIRSEPHSFAQDNSPIDFGRDWLSTRRWSERR